LSEFVPLIIAEEHEKFNRFRGTHLLSDFGKIALVVKKCTNFNKFLEEVSAAYLITNLLLMNKSHRKIIKIFGSFDNASNIGDMYSHVNSLRYFLCQEYSIINNYHLWKRKLDSVGRISNRLDNKLNEIVEFIRNSEISHVDYANSKADTMLFTSLDGEISHQGLYICDINYCTLSITDGKSVEHDFLAQSLYFDNFVIRASFSSDTVLIEVDGKDPEQSIRSWLLCLDCLFDENLFGFKIR